MTDKAVEARREYQRQWRKANKDKIKAAQKRYWEKKAASLTGIENENEEETAAEI